MLRAWGDSKSMVFLLILVRGTFCFSAACVVSTLACNQEGLEPSRSGSSLTEFSKK